MREYRGPAVPDEDGVPNEPSSQHESGSETLPPSEQLHEPVSYYAGQPPAPAPAVHRGEAPGARPPLRIGPGEDADLTDAMVFLNRIKDEYANALPVYDSFLETMRDFRFGKIDADEVCKAIRILFKDKPFLIRMFDEYLPHHLRFSEARPYEPGRYVQYPGSYAPGVRQIVLPHHATDRRAPHECTSLLEAPATHETRSYEAPEHEPHANDTLRKHRVAEDFIHLVKRRFLHDVPVYRRFVDLLQHGNMGYRELLREVNVLFHDAPELIELFERNFRPVPAASIPEETDPLRGIKEALAARGALETFVKMLNYYNQGYVSARDLIALVTPLIDSADALHALKTFINYDEQPAAHSAQDMKDYARIGSYKIFPEPLALASPAADVLNALCISVPTHESEEDTFIFRTKNSSEELLVRVSDERAENDLYLARLRCLAARLEETYAAYAEGMLGLEDIGMSPAIVKETLKSIYENRSAEVLEALLSNPAKALPVVLRRLYAVYQESLAASRRQRLQWREMVDEHYYKAYDTRGIFFRSNEKKLLTLRHIHAEAREPFAVELRDASIVELVRRLFSLYAASVSNAGPRRVSLQRQESYFAGALQRLAGPADEAMTTDFDTYALYLYICTLYARFHEVKEALESCEARPLGSNPVAVEAGLQREYCIADRYGALVAAAEALAARDMDADAYEERVRVVTDCAGYKLYNLRRILSKVERLVEQLVLREDESITPLFEGTYAVSKKAGVITLCGLDSAVEA